MQDHEDSIGQAENADALRRVYAHALAAVGVAPGGGIAQLRSLYLDRRRELGGPSGAEHVVACAEQVFADWVRRWLDPHCPEEQLRADFATREPRLTERDKLRFSLLLAARNQWRAAVDDARVDRPVLRSFEAHLTRSPYGDRGGLGARTLRRIRKDYAAIYAVDPEWFDAALEAVRHQRNGGLRRFGRALYYAGIAFSVLFWGAFAIAVIVHNW